MMELKKYFTRKTIIGIVIGLLALIGLCLMKHPVWGIFSAAAIIAFVFVPAGKVWDWGKAALVAIATWGITHTIINFGSIGAWFAKTWPVTLWLLPLILTVAAVGFYVARIPDINLPWKELGKTKKEKDPEEGDDDETDTPKILDLSYHMKGEEKNMVVKYDHSAGKVFVLYKGLSLFLRRGKDVIIHKDSERYQIQMQDGTILIVPASHAFTAALGTSGN